MRVLQLAARMVSLERFALPLMAALRDEGHQVEAKGQFDGSERRLQHEGFVTHDWVAGHSLSPLKLISARRALARLLRGDSYDVIHTHCSFGGIIANPVIRRFGPTVIYTQHGFFVHDALNPVSRALWLQIERIGLRHADRVVCISRAEHELALTLGVGPPEKFLRVPGAGIDTARFAAEPEDRARRRAHIRRELELDDDLPVLLTVSRLTWDKGYRELIAAAEALARSGHEFVLLAAGSGRDEAPIRAAITRAGLGDRLRLLGWRDDVPDLYCAADVFVFASHREGLPISPLEAMAAGLPVVLPDLPGCREEVEDGRSGLLYPRGDAEALADRIRMLLRDPDLRARLAAQAPRRARSFDLSKVLEPQLELYRELAESR